MNKRKLERRPKCPNGSVPPKRSMELKSGSRSSRKDTVAQAVSDSVTAALRATSARMRLRGAAMPVIEDKRGRRGVVQMGPRKKRELAEAFEEALDRPTAYELAVRGSGHGLPVLLEGGSVFWSKGWRGCPNGCHGRLDDWQQKLYYVESRKDGVITKQFTCRPHLTEGGKNGRW